MSDIFANVIGFAIFATLFVAYHYCVWWVLDIFFG
jgi:hypothetical protein